jgi:hypothetical protein
MSEDAPSCRWLVNDIKVDIMPTQEDIISCSLRNFGNDFGNIC